MTTNKGSKAYLKERVASLDYELYYAKERIANLEKKLSLITVIISPLGPEVKEQKPLLDM